MRRKKKLTISFEMLDDGGPNVIMLLSGSLDTETSAALALACKRILESDRRVTLDISSVKSADGVGLQLLLSLSHLSVRLVNVPSGIAQKLDAVRALVGDCNAVARLVRDRP